MTRKELISKILEEEHVQTYATLVTVVTLGREIDNEADDGDCEQLEMQPRVLRDSLASAGLSQSWAKLRGMAALPVF